MTTAQYDSTDIPDLSEIGGRWDNRRIVEWHSSDKNPVARGRRIARLPGYYWPYDPEDCTAEVHDTIWILDGKVLLCTGCGIDAT